jgi:branched-chain amino acid transport system substrate-binding protein
VTTPTEPPAVPGGPAADRAPFRLGHVNTLSGPASSSLAPVLQGVQLWARWVNDHGGIGGHEVRILAIDDGGDPARHKTAVQDLVERHRVLAFVANSDALSGPSAVDYLNEKRIPVIGVAGAEGGWQYQSPMYFPQASSGPPYIQAFFASAVRQLNARGKHKLAVISCGEVQACRDVNDQAEAQTRGRDVQVVYKARVTLAQPDFTAECLSARNAGAEGIVLALDSNGTRRVSGSCARQGYRPMYSIPIQNVADDMKDDPNLRTTLTAAASTFIYTQANTPATAEYQAAKTRFGVGVRPAGGLSTGWVAGKLFEKAAATVTEVSTPQILAGLWRIKGDDLGGVTQPLTFTESLPTEPVVCWFDMAVVDDTWASPDDFQRICEPFRH